MPSIYKWCGGRRQILSIWLACMTVLVAWLPRSTLAAAPLVLSRTGTHEVLGRNLELLEDRDRTLTIEDVTSGKARGSFEASTSDAPGFGFTKSAFWARLTVINPETTNINWYLEHTYPQLDHLDLFIPDGAGSYIVKHQGDSLPFSARDVRYRNFVFALDEPPGTRTYYLRVESTGAVHLPLAAWSMPRFLDHLTSELPLLFLFYGLMIVMIAYNLFLYASIREYVYLHYVLYISAYVATSFNLNGLGFQYFWPNNVWWANQSIPALVALGFFFGTRFSQSFLTTATTLPGMHRIMSILAWLCLSMFGLSLLGDYSLSIRGIVFLGLPVTLSILVAGIVLLKRGSRPARFFVIAWASFLFGILSFLLGTLGLLPRNFITTWGVQVGASLEVVLLSLGLADRINLMRRDLHVLNGRLESNIDDLKGALERANEATRLKGEFIASISHELKTPLNAIINVPDGLLEDFVSCPGAICQSCGVSFELESGEVLDPARACPECSEGVLQAKTVLKFDGDVAKVAENLVFIRKSGTHLLGLVEDILDFSKLEFGRSRLRLESVVLARVLADSCEALSDVASKRGIELVLPEIGIEKAMWGDALKLRQIFMNLISNAIKFSRADGRVTLGFREEGDQYIVSVQDRGIGIALEDQGKIFESFHQVEGGDTRKYGGTGLGLAISRKLVELHAGTIWVESSLGEGSTFYVRLPVDGRRGQQVSSAPGAAA